MLAGSSSKQEVEEKKGMYIFIDLNTLYIYYNRNYILENE